MVAVDIDFYPIAGKAIPSRHTPLNFIGLGIVTAVSDVEVFGIIEHF